MNQQAAASVIGAAVASAPAWAMFVSNRRANRRHTERMDALHEKVDRLGGGTPTSAGKDGGDAP